MDFGLANGHIRIGTSVGIAVSHRSGGSATMLLDCHFHHSFPLFFFYFLVVERNSTSDPVCLKFCPKFFYIIEKVIEVDELDESNIPAAAGKQDK